MKKNKLLPLIIPPITVFSIIGVSVDLNDNKEVYETTLDKVIEDHKKIKISPEKITTSISLLSNKIQWSPNVYSIFAGSKFNFNDNSINKIETLNTKFKTTFSKNGGDFEGTPFSFLGSGTTWGGIAYQAESKINHKNFNEINFNVNSMDGYEFLEKLDNSTFEFVIGYYDRDGKTHSEKTIPINMSINKPYLKTQINNLNNYLLKDKENNSNAVVKSFKISYDLDVNQTETHWTKFLGNVNNPNINLAATISNIRANIEINLEINKQYKENNFIKHILELKKDFENSNLKRKNKIEISTDVGSNWGITNYKIASDDKSNKEYLEQELNNDSFYKKYSNSELNKLGKLDYKVINNGQNLQFYYSIFNPESNQKENIIIKNLPIIYNPTQKFYNKNLSSRLRIIPGKFLDLTRPFSYKLINDVPTRDPQDTKSINEQWGGRWFYHTDASVNFNTTLREDEALIINENKIDVLDQNFHYDLKDLRKSSSKNEDKEQKDKLSNVYKIAIVKYDKANVNQSNRRELYRYETELVINSLGSDLQGKWYGWDPENNPHQRELIEPYLKNETGEYILNSRKEKIPNPKYDPLINPKTGTKEEILWVDYTGYDKLPENTRFLQDPRNYNGELLEYDVRDGRLLDKYGNFKRDVRYGFIASGSVVGKGVNLSSNTNNIELAQRFKVNQQNGGNTFSVTSKSEVDITNNDNDYFSNSGLWLYTLRDKENIDIYKMFYIGNISPQEQFTQVYKNTQIKPFWSTYHGKHLQEYLINNKLVTESDIKKLPYDQVINFWKRYVSSTYKISSGDEFNDGNKDRDNGISFIDKNGNLNTRLRDFSTILPIETDKLKDFAKIHTAKEFDALSEEELKELLIDDNKVEKDKFNEVIDFKVVRDKNEIKTFLSAKDLKNYPGLKFSEPVQITPVKWKEDVEFESKTQKTPITPSLSKEYLDSLFENATSYKDILDDIEDNLLLNFDNKDKVKYIIEKTLDNKLRFIFSVKEEFYKDYYIPRDQAILYYENEKINPNYQSPYINPFANFNLKEINLNGITNAKDAKNFITDAILKAMNNHFELKDDYVINNLDSISDNIIKSLSTPNQPLEFDLNLSANTDKSNKLLGFKTIKVSNVVANNFIPREENLSNYNISDKKFYNINTIDDMYKNLINEINSDLQSYGINFKDYLTFENPQDIAKLIIPKKINKIEIKIVPLNKILSGSKTIEVINDNTSVNSSPDVDENGKPIIKEIDYQKLAEEKLKQDQDFINSRNFPEEAEDFKNNQVKNEWEIGYVKPKGVEEIFKNLPAINGTAQIGVNKPKEQGFVEKNKSWFIPLMIISGLGVLLLLVIIYYRYLRPPIR
ncbi:hypothetical protein NPA08_02295 [Mycoplasmopsis citelli]|uniref:Mbov_0399 family ICE element protein n=1 Tax=Mycoplasmopsis citelli TaxID=171281 RepID=UPI00211414F9|nr:hypothetical protein [Mycoplasmopsis citelli]UUD36635.1 hypothetical protein NPA08_02295 [Mycoplasmopsis citelli]